MPSARSPAPPATQPAACRGQPTAAFPSTTAASSGAGALYPPDEADVKGKTFLEVSDLGVKRMTDAKGGLGLPNSFLYWHYAMVAIYMAVFLVILFILVNFAAVGFVLSILLRFLETKHKSFVYEQVKNEFFKDSAEG